VLAEAKQPAVLKAWLQRVLDARPRDGFVCGLLYTTAVANHDLGAAQIAERNCSDSMLDSQARLALAELLMGEREYERALKVVATVEQWDGRVDLKVSGWLVACDAHIALQQWDLAKRCLRRLDAAGYVRPENDALRKRFEKINETLRLQAIKP
jgi:hypothetical protein